MTGTPLAVVDYGIGNLRSAEKALQHCGGDAALTGDADEVRAAAGVVLPGVGAFGRCMHALRESGLDEAVLDVVARGTPFLGICVGMQMLYTDSEEAAGVPGLEILEGTVRRLPEGVKRPQMQWNQVSVDSGSPLAGALPDGSWVYFVHSYAPEPTDVVAATCDYGGPCVAAVAREHVWATQFHPEKSGQTGLGFLRAFVERCGA